MKRSRASHRAPNPRRRHTWLIAVVALGLFAASVAAQQQHQEQEAPADEAAAPAAAEAPAQNAAEAAAQGRLIRVPVPITGNADQRIKSMVQRALAQFRESERRPVLIFEFDPGSTEFGEGSDFTRALALAWYLSSPELASVKTVAYIPESIKGHSVLVAIACEEIVMAADAELGEAGVDESAQEPINEAVLSGYSQVAQRRRTVPVDVVLGMLDKSREVLKVETELSTEYVLRDNLDELRQRRAVQSSEVLIPQGELGRFTGRTARELGFVKYLAPDRESLARALELPETSLREDPSLAGDWRPVHVKLSGPVDVQTQSVTRNMIADELKGGRVNFLLLEIDSAGGSLTDSMTLANYVAGLPASVRTVAYVTNQAQGDAALIAVACDQLVMYPEAALGGQGQGEPQDDAVEQATRAVRELAETKGRSWSLIVALVDPTLAVYQYQNKNSGAVRYFTETEVAEQEAPEQWEQGPVVVQPGELLEVDGQRAKEFGLAWEVVDSFGQLKQAYGLEGDLRTVEPGWLDFLVRALASPGMSMLLLFIGGAAVYAELQVPGIGIAGFIASVAFLLFFWAKFLHGTAGWLEVLLFLGGFCFLLLEIFVIPGFGVFGLGGGLMIIASIVLASQRFFIPQNDTELLQLRESLIMLVGATVGIMTAAFLFRRYLPHAPIFSRLLLSPPEGEDYVKLSTRESMVDLRHLVGLRGTAQTQLTPAGKASLDGRLVDVIADGEVIDRGSTIEVVEVRGNRVLVRSIEAV